MKIMATIITLLVSIAPAWAQDLSCWGGIADCLTKYEAGDLIICCPLIRTEVTTDRECFCTMKPTFDINPSAKRGFSTLLSDTCAISYTFDMLCPDVEAPPSTPIRPPPSGDSLLTPQTTTHDSVSDSKPEESSPSGGGANLQVLIPAIVVPIVSVIGGLVKLYFIIRDRKRKKSLEKSLEKPPLV